MQDHAGTSVRSAPARRAAHPLAGCLALAALASSGAAQSFDDRWVEFAAAPDALGPASLSISSSTTEVDFAAGDLNLDGWVDVVVARKEPYTKAGMRPNLLLMNDGGVLKNRTPLFAAASDVPGDQGFLTPTNDKDVALADLTGDGWLDVVTSPTLGDGEPKHVSHPRVYRNLTGASWGGLRYEEARIPTILTPEGFYAVPRFSGVAVGDVDQDGDLDLYFVDHDSGVGGYFQTSGTDAQDHLLINDGNGYFADETLLRLTSTMYVSQFGTDVHMADLNLDGELDVVKNSTNGTNEVVALYNDPSHPTNFLLADDFHNLAPYSMNLADLNNDGRIDVVVGDDAQDRYRFNTGTDPLGRVIWGPAKTFQFLSGADDGFVGHITPGDLDGDGWVDLLIADEDTDVAGSSQRFHVYHNPGGVPGSFEIQLREERENASSGPGDWVGAVGWTHDSLRDGYDALAVDLDQDGDLDVVLGQKTGTFVWENVSDLIVCQEDLGSSGPGTAVLSMCGGDLSSGTTSDLRLVGGPPSQPAWLVLASSANPVALFGGVIVPFPVDLPVVSLATDTTGSFELEDIPGGANGVIVMQALVFDWDAPELFQFSNALEVVFLP